ncbi:ribonuclease III [Candidatus Gracilibacteria bacterium]|nr:ribonuclease III [Candidatus Gracilibacteria bacterium]
MIPEFVYKKKEEIIKYVKGLGINTSKIKNYDMLLQSFIHKSFAADFKNIADHNERLEFLGDGILGAIINKILFTNHPEMDESDLTLYKIALVKEQTLAEVANDINLDRMVFISKGEEKSQGRKKEAILSDCLEAFIGYLFLDLGIQEVEKFITKYLYFKIKEISTKPVKSYKTLIQEIVQKEHKVIPEYIDTENKIDDKGNVLEYKSEIFVLSKKQSHGFGTNKKKAQECAAENYYQKLQSKQNKSGKKQLNS